MNKFRLDDYIVEPGNKVAKRVIFNDGQTLAFTLNIAKGEQLPPHTHFESTVLLQVLKGEAEVLIDQKSVKAAKGDLIQIDGQEEMIVNNTGQQILELYVTISPTPPSEKYTVDANL
ncbi:MAG: cupin domain-containing protein [Halarsenatibacteraceae bacterium]